jgi:hypothetical protein
MPAAADNNALANPSPFFVPGARRTKAIYAKHFAMTGKHRFRRKTKVRHAKRVFVGN